MRPEIRRGQAAASSLPPLFAGWMDTLLEGSIPPEREATCDDCAMCARDADARRSPAIFFTPQTKCCTYLPALPNFLAGRILADDDPAAAPGRATVEERMRSRLAVTPFGLAIPAPYSLLYDHGKDAFGQNVALRCPHHLADGRCGVWRHRNGTCSTWFCKHERGAVGLRFWESMRRLLTAVERTLACWCVLDLGGGPAVFDRLPPPAADARGTLIAADLDGTADPDEYRRQWGTWLGREREYFVACGTRVSALTWPDVVRIGGPDITALARLARDAYADLTTAQAPGRLTVGRFHVLDVDRSGTTLWTYRGTDPLKLPPELMEVLPCFDGRPAKDVVRSVAAEQGVGLSQALVRKLVDFEVLVPVDTEGAEARRRRFRSSGNGGSEGNGFTTK